MEDKANTMSYANYGIDVEDIYKLVGTALGRDGAKGAIRYLRRYGFEYEDVEQHVMMTIYRYSPKYDADRGKPSTYLFKVVGAAIHHLMSHHTRVGQNAVTMATFSLDNTIGDGTDALSEIVGSEPFPETPADYAYIEDAIALRYGPVTARAFINVYANDVDMRKEAERVGTTYKALARRFTLCRQHLRHILRETEDYVSCA